MTNHATGLVTGPARAEVLRRRVRLIVAATISYNIVAISSFALAAYVSFDAVRSLTSSVRPDHSLVGIALAAASLAVMPALSWAERRTGRELGSASVVADSKQTLLCTYLSAVLLVGLLLNSTVGWSWADPLAALVIAAVAAREGIGAWRGDSCCAQPLALLDAPAGRELSSRCARDCAGGCGSTGAGRD